MKKKNVKEEIENENRFEQAVSPVIATILMVAITVVLSGVLYVWASGLAEDNTDGDLDLYSFSASDASGTPSAATDDALVVVTMNQGEDIGWASLTVTLSVGQQAAVTCGNPGSSTGACTIVETSTDGNSWETGEAVTISENGVDICSDSSGCEITVKVLNSRKGKLLDTASSVSEGGTDSGSSSTGGNTGGDTGGSTGAPACNAADISISEMHGGGSPEDWIEIHNAGAECDLDGFQIYDKGVKEDCDEVGGSGNAKCNERIVFVSGDTISANGYMWFCEGVCSGADAQQFGFGIKGSGDTVHLRAPDGSEVDYDTLGDEAGSTEFDCSTGVQTSGPHGSTPGAANNCYSVTLVVNEVANKGSSGVCLNADGSGDTEDWIEIWNYGANAIDMTGMQIVDDKTLYEDGVPNDDVYSFSTTLGAGQYLLLCNDDSPSGDAQFPFGIGGDDSVLLYDANENLIHTSGPLPEAACEADPACNEDDVYVMDNTGAWGYTTGPTPGAEN